MPRALRVTLITIGVILILYGIYYVIGRPAIPLPAIRYPVPAGQPLHDIITATDSNQVRVTLNTKGKLEMLSAENELVTLDYTPETLANTVDLALRLAPGQTLSSYQQFVERFPVYPFLINYVNQFFYRFLPLQLSVILIPQQ